MIAKISLALSLSILASLSIADDAAIKKLLQREYDRSADAMIHKDFERALSIAHPDLVWVNKDGSKWDVKEIKQKLSEQASAVASFDAIANKIVSLKVSGATAIATTSNLLKATIKANGKTHKLANASQTRDTWVLASKVWKLKKVETLKESVLIDGKPQKG